ncbi:hypothetical protein [Rhizobium sullae]|uniref:hypothetical protein n=1 Tax=Rhizobium sullae TaxID=50338 RepID=UPI000B351464|nr:hypothetical protein [Rhizobium sullae]
MAFDGEKFGREVVGIVKDYLRRQLEPMEARLAILEAQAGIEKSKPVVRIRAVGRNSNDDDAR